MKDFAQREDDRALDAFMKKRKGYVGPYLEGEDVTAESYVADAGNLTTNEHLSFSIFQRGEIAALAGLDSHECPFHEERDVRWQEIWHRGFVYGSSEGED